jgi:hypothetical protein
MSQADRQAFVRDLQRIREGRRWRMALATFHCEAVTCAIGEVRISVEEAEPTKPMQPPRVCPRCRVEMAYVGLSLERRRDHQRR